MQNLIGLKFNKLTVIEFHHKHKQYNKKGKYIGSKIYWLCQCDCGNFTIVNTSNLKSNSVKSCGCLKHSDYNSTHKMSKSRLYVIWCNMKARCYNTNNLAYKNYGGRGIKICDTWLNNFQCFYEWAINNGYKENLSIDRINTNGNYEPLNCRFADDIQQANNRRNNHYITYNNETHTISEWSKIYNIPYNLLRSRINQLHWSFEKAILI